jgi:tRNA-splicing ligase RtcB (3'-phosphate/5'-hydroxy nucleic acid ligase)
MSTTSYETMHVEGGRDVKMWTRGVPVEDAAKEQLVNTARMPFIFQHVAAMPDVHLGIGATVGSVVATKGAIIPAAVGVDIGCFVGETRLPLLNGTQRTLEDLASQKEPFWVYSVDSRLNVAPGRAICRKTRSDAELVRVVVSGGDEIVCTPDHKFMMSNGSYRRADRLRFNDSLMPLYRRWQTRDGYESVSCGTDVQQTHLLVWESLNGAVPAGHVVHHRDHVHFNNEPDNLELMTQSAHSAYHRAVGYKFNNADPRFRARRLAGIARSNSDPIMRAQRAQVGARNITAYMRGRPEEFRAAVAGNGRRGAPYLRRFNTSPRACDDCGHEAANPGALHWHKRRAHGYNHKVIEVQRVTRRADVYCLQVEEHHNFALAAGVFVHNCGMMAIQTTLKATDLPDSLGQVRAEIERAVPHGFVTIKGRSNKGAWAITPNSVVSRWEKLATRLERIEDKHPRLKTKNPQLQLGTLGGGNHFIEVCLDTEQTVWVMLHSGSRGIGNLIGQQFIETARQDMQRHFINLPNRDLAYFVEGTEHFDDYVEAMSWAQDYAAENRRAMMDSVMHVLRAELRPFQLGKVAVNCHHNYTARETHFGEEVLVTRKGAVRAGRDELGIIPGSMGARSYIVRGLGNPESFESCSHGAGRKMSRTAAKKLFTVAEHEAATAGVECRKDAEVIDETPAAYKDIEAVMAAQKDLVEIVHTLKQVVCVKG